MARRACGPPTITNAHAESHRVAKVAQGGRFEESRGRGGAALCAGKQAGRWRRGASGAARFTRADTTCGETMEAWQAWRRQPWRRQPWSRQPWRGRRGTRALRLTWRTWVGVVSKVESEG